MLKYLAVIPDGNRRYAKKTGKTTEEAYYTGIQNSTKIIEEAKKLGVTTVSFWGLSLDNFMKRGSDEIGLLFKLMTKAVSQILKKSSKELGLKFKVYGRKDLLPATLVKAFNELEEYSKNNKDMTVNLFIAYSGRQELTDAMKEIALDVSNKKLSPEKIDEKLIEKHLYLSQEPDLIIRTGGVDRISGFLTWQNTYSEYYFSEKLWPEFGSEDLKKAIEYFNSVERRFGK
ncbi:Tritrans,polycis-undecaprenyl-diphosphate synthase (GGDP specific) [uncultured archaeon]|nr:Tritrans,polycis-undecaprenyl-diphosphate synthase (GGDP specific) [uncultured archaeon]